MTVEPNKKGQSIKDDHQGGEIVQKVEITTEAFVQNVLGK